MQKNKRASDHSSILREVRSTTRKKNKCVTGCKRGRTIRKGYLFLMKESTRLQEEADAAFDKQFGSAFPDRDVPSPKFEEQKFGRDFDPHQNKATSPLSARVISIALFDGDKMLFACTGMALPRGSSGLPLTRFVTSSRLITVFEYMRRKNDKLKVAVCLPNKKVIAGVLGLYDEYIAIVTSLGFRNVRHVEMYQEIAQTDIMEAVGRAYEEGNLMSTMGVLRHGIEEDLLASTCQITEAGLGGPLIDPRNGNIIGMNICFHNDEPRRFHNDTEERVPLFLPWNLLRQRLEKYDILTPSKRPGGIITPYRAGFSSGKTNNISQGSYEPPPGASRIIPSGFLDIWNWLEFMGYPKPPPLMLELNGRLVRRFEDVFGWLHAWKGYKYDIPDGHGENAWPRFDKKIVTTISRRVVSLVSFKGDKNRFFSCTGFLVSTPVRYRQRHPCPIVVTSASLVRTCDATDTIDEKMRIEVFLPPNQRLTGTLCSYHSGYNIAVVTVKGLRNIRPEQLGPDFHLPEIPDFHLPESVVAIGREPEGLLCASMGKLVNPKNIMSRKAKRSTCERESKGEACASVGEPDNSESIDRKYERSTCAITKVGIGGPLIDLATGCVVGMNFYDGKPGRTPYIPVERIYEVLQTISRTPSIHSGLRVDYPNEETCNRWQVPKPYWYHGLLEVDRFCPMPMRGRILD